MFKDVAKLKYIVHSADADGISTETLTSYDVYVEKKSVKGVEFYASMQTGIRPSIVFKLRNEDWEVTRHIVNAKAVYAELVEYDSATYKIVREYTVGDGMTEIVCE